MYRKAVYVVVFVCLFRLFAGCATTKGIEKWRAAKNYGRIADVLTNHNEKTDTRIAAARALSDLDDNETVDLLSRVARDTQEELSICEECILSLAKIAKRGNSRSLGVLQDLNKSDPRCIYSGYPVFKVSLGKDRKLRLPLRYAQGPLMPDSGYGQARQGPIPSYWTPPEVNGEWSTEELFGFRGHVYTPFIRKEGLFIFSSDLGVREITMNTEEFTFEGTYQEANLFRSGGARVALIRDVQGYYPIRSAANQRLRTISEGLEFIDVKEHGPGTLEDFKALRRVSEE
jgi:hypothetical protein